MNKMITCTAVTKRVASFLCLSSFMLLALGAQAAEDFASDAMAKASGFTGGTVSGWTLSVTDGSHLKFVDTLSSPDALNRQARGWYAGATITWPTRSYWPYAPYATDGQARMKTTRMSAEGTGENPGSGNGLTVSTDGNDMESTTWWAWITPEEAFAVNGGVFQQKLNMYAGRASIARPGVNAADFYVNINTASLTLKDDNGIQWFPAVATNAAGKVYGDLNVALKASGTIVSVADAAITQAITNEAGLVFLKGSFNITGLDKMTLLGGSYDFKPTDAGCTLGQGCIEEYNNETRLWDVKPCPHDWSYEVNPAGDTFTATCSKGCGYTPQTVSVAITPAGGKTYDGKELTAALSYNKSPEEFATQTGATVGEIEWTGDKKSAGDHTASVTITVKTGATYTISNTVTIAQAPMSSSTVTLKSTSFNFSEKEQTNAIASVTSTAGSITESDWEIVNPEALYGAGSGYSNVTYTVTLRGKGNFTGTQTATWTVVAPARALGDMGRGDWEADSKLYNDNYGECDQATRTLNVTATTNIIFVNNCWWVGMTVDLPTDINWLSPSDSSLTPDEDLRIKVSTTGKTYTGTQIFYEQVKDTILDGDHARCWWDIGAFYYYKKIRWFTPVTPAMIEEAKSAGKKELTFTMTVGGLTSKPCSSTTWEGLTYKDFTIKLPVDGFIFKVGRHEYNSANLGNMTFAGGTPKILLQNGSVVTNACKVDYTSAKYVYTDVAGCDVIETTVSDSCWVYSCGKGATLTIGNVPNQASKVVTKNATVVDPIDVEKTQYKVREGDTVSITYTAEPGWEPATTNLTMTDVRDGDILSPLPVFTWPNVTVEAEALEHASKAEIYTNGVCVGVSPCVVASNAMVTVVYTADAGYFFHDAQHDDYPGSNTLAAVKAASNPTTVSKSGAGSLPLIAAAAQIGAVYQPTLGRALKAAETDQTVKLLRSCSNETSYAVATAITLDENGFEATNICIAATGTVAFKGVTTCSANQLRAQRPSLFGELAHGAQATTDKTYAFVKVLDVFYEAGHQVIATTYDDQGGTYLESYATFDEGLEAVATNGTLYALVDVTNDGFTVSRDMTIDLAKAANGGPGYALTLKSAANKAIGIEVASTLTNVVFRGGTVKTLEAAALGTVLSSSAAGLTLDGVTIDGEAMTNKTVYAVQLTGGATTLTNATILLSRATKAYALSASAYGRSTGNAVTFLGVNTVTGNLLVNAQNVVPVNVAFGALVFDANYKLTVNACNDKTVVTKAASVTLPLDATKHPELCWTSVGGGLERLTDGKVWWIVELGDTGYRSTLTQAFADVTAGQTIRLCADAMEGDDVDATDGVTVDLNGHTLTMAGEHSAFTVYDVTVTIVGTNENSRFIGQLWAYDGAKLTVRGGTYSNQIGVYGTADVLLADMILTRDRADEGEVALQLGSFGYYGATYDKDLAVTVINSRITGYSAVYMGGGKLTVSNSVLVATGTKKRAVDHSNWMGATGDALVIDQVPGCPIAVDVQAGSALYCALNSTCDQLGWYKQAKTADDKATATKHYVVDLMAPLGYAWYGDTNTTIRTLVRTDGQTAYEPIADMGFARNTADLTSAYTTNAAAGGKMTIAPNRAVTQPEDLTIDLLDSTVLINFTSMPDFTYELMTSETPLNPTDPETLSQWEVVARRAARETTTTFTTDKKVGATAEFYTVRLVEE